MPLSPASASLVAAALLLTPAAALAAPQPPMNSFNSAYYVCDAPGQFALSYDSARPKTARMTTNGSKTYELKRQPAASGARFSDDKVTLVTDGKAATVEGAEVPLTNCKMQSS